MIPAKFDYERASTVEHAIELLGSSDDAKLLAGGHSLLPLMKLRFSQPSLLVDIGRLSDLSYIREAGDRIEIGALTRHHDVATSDLLESECRILAHAAAKVGDPQVRHRGTIGGSVAHGDPASDLPTVLLALDAELVTKDPDGERTLPASEFFTGFLETALGPREVLTHIRVPKVRGGSAYEKFNRRAQDWAIVGAVAVRNGDDARVALVNMGSTPLRATAVERALAEGATAEAAAELAAEGTDPGGDIHATPEFRAHLARVLVHRALTAASV